MGLSHIHFHLYKVTIQQQQIILLALQVLIVIKITFEYFLPKHFENIVKNLYSNYNKAYYFQQNS